MGIFNRRVDELDRTTRRMVDLGDHSPCLHYMGGSLLVNCQQLKDLRGSPWEWFSVPWMSLTAAYGIPLPSRISSHSCVVFFWTVSSIKPSIISRCWTRSLLVTNRGSVFHSGKPNRSHSTPKSRSLPPPNRMSPSRVL